MKISAVIITFNEAHIIGKTLAELGFCDEIIIVDSGSTDKTNEICSGFNCTIFQRNFDGYGAQKNFGIKQAKNDWILNIDADEILSSALRKTLTEFEENNAIVAYKIKRNTVFLNHEMCFSGLRSEFVLRFFNRKFCSWDLSLVHEKVNVDGNIALISSPILHHTAKDEISFIEKNKKYAVRAAAQMFQKGKKAISSEAFARKCIKFIEIYILKMGFLDGKSGWKWAKIMSDYTFEKYRNLYLLNKQTNA